MSTGSVVLPASHRRMRHVDMVCVRNVTGWGSSRSAAEAVALARTNGPTTRRRGETTARVRKGTVVGGLSQDAGRATPGPAAIASTDRPAVDEPPETLLRAAALPSTYFELYAMHDGEPGTGICAGDRLFRSEVQHNTLHPTFAPLPPSVKPYPYPTVKFMLYEVQAEAAGDSGRGCADSAVVRDPAPNNDSLVTELELDLTKCVYEAKSLAALGRRRGSLQDAFSVLVKCQDGVFRAGPRLRGAAPTASNGTVPKDSAAPDVPRTGASLVSPRDGAGGGGSTAGASGGKPPVGGNGRASAGPAPSIVGGAEDEDAWDVVDGDVVRDDERRMQKAVVCLSKDIVTLAAATSTLHYTRQQLEYETEVARQQVAAQLASRQSEAKQRALEAMDAVRRASCRSEIASIQQQIAAQRDRNEAKRGELQALRDQLAQDRETVEQPLTKRGDGRGTPDGLTSPTDTTPHLEDALGWRRQQLLHQVGRLLRLTETEKGVRVMGFPVPAGEPESEADHLAIGLVCQGLVAACCIYEHELLHPLLLAGNRSMISESSSGGGGSEAAGWQPLYISTKADRAAFPAALALLLSNIIVAAHAIHGQRQAQGLSLGLAFYKLFLNR